jgi:hypothetical protein
MEISTATVITAMAGETTDSDTMGMMITTDLTMVFHMLPLTMALLDMGSIMDMAMGLIMTIMDTVMVTSMALDMDSIKLILDSTDMVLSMVLVMKLTTDSQDTELSTVWDTMLISDSQVMLLLTHTDTQVDTQHMHSATTMLITILVTALDTSAMTTTTSTVLDNSVMLTTTSQALDT